MNRWHGENCRFRRSKRVGSRLVCVAVFVQGNHREKREPCCRDLLHPRRQAHCTSAKTAHGIGRVKKQSMMLHFRVVSSLFIQAMRQTHGSMAEYLQALGQHVNHLMEGMAEMASSYIPKQ